MKNSEKPKKKKYSLFCCFSMNNKRKNKQKINQQQSTNTVNKTNITEQNLSIKVSGFAYGGKDKISQKSKNYEKRTINSYISQKNKNIKEDLKNDISLFSNKNKNNKNFISFYDVNDVNKDKQINSKLEKFMIKKNRDIEEKKDKPIFLLNNIKNISIKENESKINKSKVKITNNNKILISNTNKEEVFINENNVTSNKVEISLNENKLNKGFMNKGESNLYLIDEKTNNQEKNEINLINKIPIKSHQTNIIKNTENMNTIFSFYEKENNELNLSDKYNINIYDNNSQMPIKLIEKKEEISPTKMINKNKIYNYSINNEMKKKINKDKIISLFNSSNNNQTKQKEHENNINIKKLKTKYYFNVNNKLDKKNKSYCIYNTNLIDSFLFLPSKLKYSKSSKLIKTINFETIKSFILNNCKTYKNDKISENLNCINTININNIINANKLNIKKEDNSDFSPAKNSFNNKMNRLSSKKKYNKLPLTSIGKKLQSMNYSSFIIKNSKSNLSQNLTYIQSSQEKENINLNKIPNKSKITEAFASVEIFENSDNVISKNKTCINKDCKDIIKNVELERNENKKDKKNIDADIEEEKEESESKNINDSKSIISNYIVSHLMNIKNSTSFAPSQSSKSELKINLTNRNDLQSSKCLLYIPPGINEEEIEISNVNRKEYKSFLETPRTSGNCNKKLTHKNYFNSGNKNSRSNNYGFNRSISTQITSQIKNITDKINYNTKEIKKTNKKIEELNKEIIKLEEWNQKYKLWIEKEETENEILMNMLNYLNSNYMK